MHEIKISVEDKNLETVQEALNNLDLGLINNIETTSINTTHVNDVSKETPYNYSSASNRPQMDPEKKRKKLFSFAFITLIILSLASVYFEMYHQTQLPSFLRFMLALYWLYSLAGVIISKLGSDYWVSKMYFNISR